MPAGPGEKIICLKNQNNLGLINGMFITLEDIVDEGSLFFTAVVRGEEGKVGGSRPTATAPPAACASTRGTSRTTSPMIATAMTATGARSG